MVDEIEDMYLRPEYESWTACGLHALARETHLPAVRGKTARSGL